MFDFTSSTMLIILISTILPLALTGFILWKVFSWLSNTGKERQRLLRDGVAAQATILSIWETHLYVNNQPQIGILLEVTSPSGQVFQTQTKMIISQLQIPQFQPGTRVMVKYDPADFTKITIAGVLNREAGFGQFAR